MIKFKEFYPTKDFMVAAVGEELKHATVTENNLYNRYLSRDEVSKLLKISLSTIHNWTKSGTLQPYQIGGRIYFKYSDIEGSMVKLNYRQHGNN